MARRSGRTESGDSDTNGEAIGGGGIIGGDEPITTSGNGDAEIGVSGSQGGIGGSQEGSGEAREIPVIDAPKKRGRKSNAEKARLAGETLQAVAGRVDLKPKELAPKIEGLHVMLATLTKQPIFVIKSEEAMLMAEAIADLSKHYDLNIMSGPKATIINMVAVCGMIYVPRIMAINAMKRQARTPTQPNTPESVVMETVAKANHPGATVDFTGLN